jgi:hypothetical protein
MMENNELVQQVNKELAITISEKISLEELHSQLAIHINQLILHHFEQLVSLLYRIDVSEAKIKSLLSRQSNENAGNIIATLIIERQVEKIKSRRQFRQQNDDFDEVEKW